MSIVGLGSIWLALKERTTSEEISWITSYQAIESLSLEIDKPIADHSNLVPYFLEGKKVDKNSPDYDQVVSVADLRIGAIDAMLLDAHFRNADNQITGWRNTFISYFRNSPSMCERYEINKQYYGSQLPPIVESGCAK